MTPLLILEDDRSFARHLERLLPKNEFSIKIAETKPKSPCILPQIYRRSGRKPSVPISQKDLHGVAPTVG